MVGVTRVSKVSVTVKVEVGCRSGIWLAAWRSVNGIRRMNEVNARRARLVPRWVTVFGRVYHLGM